MKKLAIFILIFLHVFQFSWAGGMEVADSASDLFGDELRLSYNSNILSFESNELKGAEFTSNLEEKLKDQKRKDQEGRKPVLVDFRGLSHVLNVKSVDQAHLNLSDDRGDIPRDLAFHASRLVEIICDSELSEINEDAKNLNTSIDAPDQWDNIKDKLNLLAGIIGSQKKKGLLQIPVKETVSLEEGVTLSNLLSTVGTLIPGEVFVKNNLRVIANYLHKNEAVEFLVLDECQLSLIAFQFFCAVLDKSDESNKLRLT